ncbi:hypothetical protein JXA32_01035 [Candidatus Sumerlaeota bacterium]|nr:hypothetical protein [Candidatus Sumerlaeota bacterium]
MKEYIEQLLNYDPNVREKACQTIRAEGPDVIDDLIEALYLIDEKEGIIGLGWLANGFDVCSPACIPKLIIAMQSENEKIRYGATCVLCSIAFEERLRRNSVSSGVAMDVFLREGEDIFPALPPDLYKKFEGDGDLDPGCIPPEAIAAIVKCFQDPSNRIRRHALEKIHVITLGADIVIPALIEFLEDESNWSDCSSLCHAISALCSYGPKAAVAVPAMQYVIAIKKFGSHGGRYEIRTLDLFRIGLASIPLFAEVFKWQDSQFIDELMELHLINFGKPVIPAMVELLDYPNPVTHLRACFVLFCVNTDMDIHRRMTAMLRQYLKHPDVWIRKNAAFRLRMAKLSDKADKQKNVEALIEALGDKKIEVCKMAMQSIGELKINRPGIVPIIEDFINTKPKATIPAALSTLSKISKVEPEAVDLLKKIATGPDEFRAKKAKSWLRKKRIKI